MCVGKRPSTANDNDDRRLLNLPSQFIWHSLAAAHIHTEEQRTDSVLKLEKKQLTGTVITQSIRTISLLRRRRRRRHVCQYRQLHDIRVCDNINCC